MEKTNFKKNPSRTHYILNVNREDLFNEEEFYEVYKEKGFTDFEIKVLIEQAIQRKLIRELIVSNKSIQNNVLFFFWISILGILIALIFIFASEI